MHTVIKSLLKQFSEEHNFDKHNIESKQLEYYLNYLIVSEKASHPIQPYEITTQDNDASIDGIAILVDGNLITNLEEIKDLFENNNKKFHVELILTQIKTADKFIKKDITNFYSGISTFLNNNSSYPQGDFNLTLKEIFFYILENPRNINNSLPDISVYYCTTGIYRKEVEIEESFKQIENDIREITYFNKVTVKPIDREAIIKLQNTINNNSKVKISVKEIFAMPESKNIPSSFLSLVNAKEYVQKLLFNDEGTGIKTNIFDENIRAYLGDDLIVNENIERSLQSPETNSIFSILNNGITIIASELFYSPSKKEIDLTNHQIINGCQTSNILFQNYENLGDETNLIVKFIATNDSETINSIISSTNSQSHIDDYAFLSLSNKAKMIQEFFKAKNNSKTGSGHEIYFERRRNEFHKENILSSRIFNLRSVVQAYSSMFLDIPYLASRYVKKIFEEKELFKEDDVESYYYIATLCLYKIQVMINSKKFQYSKLKWHFLYAFKFLVLKNINGLERNSHKAKNNEAKLLNVLNNKDKFEKIVTEFESIIEEMDMPTPDSLKRQKYTFDLKAKILEKIK